MTKRSVYLAVGTALLATVARCEPQRWFNLTVTEQSEATEVTIHLPVPMVLAVLDTVDVKDFRRGRVRLHHTHADLDWQAVLREVRAAPEGMPVTIKGSESDMVVTKAGGLVEVKVDEPGPDGASVTLRVPVEFLDTLSLEGEESTVDVRSIVKRLGDTTGELLSVDSPEATVRIWVE